MAITILSTILSACAGERPTDLGVRGGLLIPCPASPNCVSSQADAARHRIAPLTFRGDPAAAFARLQRVLTLRDDTTVVETTAEYLRVEFRTRLFTDDGEFLLDRRQGVIHVRSASRLGYSDLGKNRRRLEEIRAAFTRQEETP